MDNLIPNQMDLYYLFEHQSMVPQGNDMVTSHPYLPGQPATATMDEAHHHSSDRLSIQNSLRGPQHHQHQNLYQPLGAVTPHSYFPNPTASIPSQMYIPEVDSSNPVILSGSSPYRVGALSGGSNDIAGHLFVDSIEHRSYDSQNAALSGHEAYMEEIPIRREPEADRVRLAAKQYSEQAYGGQDSSRRATPSRAGRRKKQDTDDDMSELESSDNRKTSSDITRQRGRPRLDTRDESQAERRRTQIRLAQRAYRLRKETTITSLRSRVAELESAMEGMQEAFAELHSAAASMAQEHGHNNHTFTTLIDCITERFCNLAKTASMKTVEGNISCDEDADAYGADHSGEELNSSCRKVGSSQIRG